MQQTNSIATKRLLIIYGALFSLVSGCVSTSEKAVKKEPVVIEERAVVDGQALPLPEEPSLKAESIESGKSASPVVKRLMASAQDSQAQGDWDAASGSLERALRIEPRNAQLWSNLAEVRFDQGQYKAAIQLAAKSNTLAGENRYQRRRNWLLMANAYEKLDNPIAAERYRQKLDI